MTPIRWHAVVHYRSAETGTVVHEYDLEELYELHDLVEHGPHWDTIEKIEVLRTDHITDASLTIEQAEEL